MRERVAPIGERVDDEIGGGRDLSTERDQRMEVLERRVDAAVGDESQQMQPLRRRKLGRA